MSNSKAAIDWQWHTFASFSARELYAVLAARAAVFIVEQNCPYQDADGLDNDAMHLVGWDGDLVAAYLRVLAPGVKYEEPSIGRVLTEKSHRGSGVGHEMMVLGLEYAARQFLKQGVRISAQAHLERFYGRLGFVRVSGPYLEDDIPHIEMLRAPD